MEFDSTLTQIQGTLLSFEKNLGSLKSFKYGDENEAIVVAAFKKAIKQAPPSRSEETKRKVHFYLVLNTDFPIQETLSEDDNISHLLNTAPTLSQDLLVAIVRGCKLLPFACEVLIYCEPALSIQYFNAILSQSGKLGAKDMINESFNLIPATFLRIVRLSKNIEICNANKKFIMKKMFDIFLTLIENITPQLHNKLQDASKSFIMEISGKVTKNMISLVLQCLAHLEKQNFLDWYPEPSLLDHDYSQWGEGEVDVMACLDFVAVECRKNMETITLDMWMEWEDCPGDADCKHVQAEIAEEAYLCINKETSITSDSIIALKVILMGFQSKPLDESDEIKAADISRIISCIGDKNKSQSIWLEALLKRDDCFSTIDALTTVKSHLNLLNTDTTAKLMNLAVVGNSIDDIMLKELAFEAFQHVPLIDQPKLIEDFFTLHTLIDTFKTSSFDATLTSVLNRSEICSARREKWLPELLGLCLQSPCELVERIVMAGVVSRGQATLMCSALTELQSVCGLEVASDESTTSLLLHALSKAMATLDPATSQITHLVMLLDEKGLLGKVQFLRTCVMPALKRDLAAYKVPHIQLWLQLLKRLLKVDLPQTVRVEAGLSLAVILALLAEVLQRASWVLGKFRQQESLLRADTVLLVRPLACRMANTSEPEDRELLWLRAGLLKLTSHNRSHFSALWTHFGLPVPSMNLGALLLSRDAMCQQSSMPPGGPDQLLSPLLILLPTCCTPEWRLLASSLSTLQAYHTTGSNKAEHDEEEEGEEQEEEQGVGRSEEQMLPDVLRLLVTTLMLQALMLSQQQPDDHSFSNDCALACLENSVRNLGIVMKEEWVPRLSGVGVVEAGAGVVRQVALLLRSLPAALAGSCSLALSGVLVQAQEVLLLQASANTELATWCAHELALSLALLPDRESRQALSRKLLLEPALAQL